MTTARPLSLLLTIDLIASTYSSPPILESKSSPSAPTSCSSCNSPEYSLVDCRRLRHSPTSISEAGGLHNHLTDPSGHLDLLSVSLPQQSKACLWSGCHPQRFNTVLFQSGKVTARRLAPSLIAPVGFLFRFETRSVDFSSANKSPSCLDVPIILVTWTAMRTRRESKD